MQLLLEVKNGTFLNTLFNVCMNNTWLFAHKRGYDDMLAFTRSVVQGTRGI